MPIPNDYRVYLLADNRYREPDDMLKSIMLGRCNFGRPPDNATAPGVDSMLSATDMELEKWLDANEKMETRFHEGNKLCDPQATLAERVMALGEWGPRAYSNYSLFEWSSRRTPPSGHSYLYLRGQSQRVTKYFEYFGTNLYKIKELHDVWLIATNWRVNFSVPQTADEEDESSAAEDDESCKNGTARNNILESELVAALILV